MKDCKKQDAKGQYRKVLELGFVAALLICQAVVLFLKEIDLHAETESVTLAPIKVEYVPATKEKRPPVAPERPPVVIESDDPNLPESETISPTTEFNLNLGKPPSMPVDDDETYEIFEVSEPPRLLSEIALRYPERARQMQLEGKVVVKVLVDTRGRTTKSSIFKSSGFDMLDLAALQAVADLRWEPAWQRDRKVKVWVALPITFRLR